ncbi:MAG: peptidylprolyl isomerase [Phycisphaeraceae bacterium]|nr:peptidylprolyl isomerase [Phycisphaeraceae bacterium]
MSAFARLFVLLFLVGLIPAVVGGCAGDDATRDQRRVQPADFSAGAETVPPERRSVKPTADNPDIPGKAGEPVESETTDDESTSANDPAGATVVATADPDRPASNDDDAWTVDGMVGQVNGRPLYARDVLGPLEAQLQALGRNPDLSRSQFRSRAAELIASRLQQLVADELILGEAERDLSEQERFGLSQMLDQKREEMLRFYGEGSRALAETRLREQRGIGLEEAMEQERQAIVVKRYLGKKLHPKINVSRRDIERYYRENLDEFQPPPGRTIHLIRVRDEEARDKVAQRLSQGETFLEVARSDLNTYKPDVEGLFAKAVEGDEVFGAKPLNDAMLDLKEGQHAGPLEFASGYAWVYVASISGGEGRSLKDAQRDIENLLRRQRFQALSAQYRQRLFRTGVYNPLDEMTEDLLAIAIARYDTES